MAKKNNSPKPEGQAPKDAAAGQQLAKYAKSGGVCGNCGALLPKTVGCCLVCGTQRGALPRPEEFPLPPSAPVSIRRKMPTDKDRARKSPEIWQRWAAGLSAVLLICIVSIAGFNIYRQYFDTSSYQAGNAVVFQSSTGQLMLSYPGLDQPQQITGIRRPGNGQLRASANGRWIAYIAQSGGLYMIDLAQQQVPGSHQLSAVLLAEMVSDSVEFGTGSEYLVYLTKAQEMFASNFTENWMLDSGVDKIIAVDQRRVLYTRLGDSSDESRMDLYLDYLSRDGGERTAIDRGVTQVLDWTTGFERVLYTTVLQDVSGRDGNWLNSFDLRSGAATQLADGADLVLDASAEKATAVYLSLNTPIFDYESFIDDDMAEEDTLVTEPDLVDYPVLAEAISIYGEEGEFTDIEDNEELVEQNRLYDENTVLWNEKQERDVLRMYYRNEFSLDTDYVELYDLFVWRNGGATQLDNGVWLRDPLTKAGGHVNAEKNYVFYEKIDPNSLKRMKISDLFALADLSSFRPSEYFFENTQRELLFSFLDNTPVRIYTRSGMLLPKQWQVSPLVDGIYFSVGTQEMGIANADEFYFAPIKNGVVGDATLAGKQSGQLGQAFRNGLLFHGPGGETLYFYQNGSSQQISGKNSQIISLENNGNTLLHFREMTSATGTLWMLTQQEQFIAEGVSLRWRPWYRSDELIYYALPGKEARMVDLYAYQNGRNELVQAEVYDVLRFPEKTTTQQP